MIDDTLTVHTTSDVINNRAAEPPSIFQRGEFVALGSTSFVERLPNGDIIKTAWPGADRVAERRRELALESQIYDRLGQHPRIVKKKAWDPDNHTLTLEYMPNGTLKAYLESDQHVSMSQRRRWIMQAAEGVELLHRSAVIHCDVGPHNYLLDHQLDLKIADFAGSSLNHSATDTCPGARYTPPHLDRTWYQNPGRQVDIFALGSTIYYILTGKAPFAEFDSENVEKRYLAHEFPDLADIPYAEIIRGCWLQEFASGREVMELMKNTYSVSDEVCGSVVAS
ncbi:kinase-like domain-containing protein [Fusarium redolens]|uniref:Kinase-like domain-containing protein n=1 Tax=Fusarium redolens TaxID=48865 RepID=A0A9P9K0T8_FUSRE|nr:kinase-like domain-containing protein [Fusarium redolens]KAH7240056.1 kinase-like domain-containing protein [Fusarium redolens]